MISAEEIKRLSIRGQTSSTVTAREYVQHCLLSELYKLEGAEKLLFKGGTALRIIYHSPRFSEDLDFTGIHRITYYEIKNILTKTLVNLNNWGFKTDINEAKKTPGGYLANLNFSFLEFKISIKVEISFRQSKQRLKAEISRIKNEYIPYYDIIHLPIEEIIKEKINALLSRAKARDWYDFYFFLNNRMLSPKQKDVLPQILLKLKRTKTDFKKDLKNFLPRSHYSILKNFKNNLIKEIEAYSKKV